MSPKRPSFVISLSAGNLACIVYSRAIKLLIVSSRKKSPAADDVWPSIRRQKHAGKRRRPSSSSARVRARAQRVPKAEPCPSAPRAHGGPSWTVRCGHASRLRGTGGRRRGPTYCFPHLVPPHTPCLSPSTFLPQVGGLPAPHRNVLAH